MAAIAAGTGLLMLPVAKQGPDGEILGIVVVGLRTLVICFWDGLVGNQIDAVCRGQLVIVLDSGNIGIPTSDRPMICVRVSGVMMVIFVARFIEVMIQFLLRFPPALANGPHLPGAWRSMHMLVRDMVPRVLIGFVAHKGMVPPDVLCRKTRPISEKILFGQLHSGDNVVVDG